MTVDTKTPDTAPFTTTLPIPETDPIFNWKNCWYPVTFLQDLPKNRPYSFSLYNESFVLFRGKNGNLTCLIDRCPHRAAKLSDGQVIDGKIECLYHGWQFGSDGECLHIPQLAADAKIPKNACVESFKVVEHQGIIWMWRGEPEAADKHSIFTLPDLDEPGVVYTDKITDIPYDYSYFIEHTLDLAHLNFVHDGSQGNRNRKNAQPLEMEVIETSNRGIRGRVRDTNQPNQSWISFEFIAPNIARFQVTIEQRGWFIGQVFHVLPLSQGRCRLLSRSYRNFFPWQVKLTPRWLIHMNHNKILEEDFLLVGQQERIEQLGKNLQEVYTPIDTSDLLVIEYRKWLDRFGYSLPFYRGYATSKGTDKAGCNQNLVQLDRYVGHTQLCPSCNRAYQITKRMKQVFIGVAIALAALAIVTDDNWTQIAVVLASLSSVTFAVWLEKLKNKFERASTHH